MLSVSELGFSSNLVIPFSQTAASMGISEDSFRTIVDNIPTMVWGCGLDGTTRFVNQQWLSFTGLTLPESIALGWRGSLHPEDQARVASFWNALTVTGELREIEARIQRSDLDYRWFLIRAAPLKNENGITSGWCGASTDIDDLKRNESLHRAETRSLEMLADGSSLSSILENICLDIEANSEKIISTVLLLDEDGKTLHFAAGKRLPQAFRTFLRILEVGPQSCSCGTAAHLKAQVIAPNISSDPMWSDHREIAMQSGLHAAWSQPLISKSGELLGTFCNYYVEPRDTSASDIRLLEAAASLTVNAVEGDHSRGILSEALERVTRSEIQMRATIDAIPTQVWWAIPDGSTEFQNRRWLEYAGVTADEAKDWGWKNAIHPDDVEQYLKRWHEIHEAGGAGEAEARFRRFDGEYRRFLMRVDVLRDESGKIAKWYGVNTDIEDLRSSEEALQHAHADLTRISRLTTMGEFAASIAHEVNQPLMAIGTNAEACIDWLAHEPPNLVEARQAAERIVANATHAGEIVKSIHALSRKSEQDIGEFNINKSIKDILAIIEGELFRHGITLKVEVSPNALVATGAQVQFQQVILNLVRNAIESMESVVDAQRMLRITTERVENEILISISDTGVGFTTSESHRIFEAFFTTKPHGMGMGLSICKSIVETHGGRIWVTANQPSGTIFHFSIPITGARDHEAFVK